jgi:hypothetical protein
MALITVAGESSRGRGGIGGSTAPHGPPQINDPLRTAPASEPVPTNRLHADCLTLPLLRPLLNQSVPGP